MNPITHILTRKYDSISSLVRRNEKVKLYLDRRPLPHTYRVVEIRVRSSFLRVYSDEAEVVPDAFDEIVQAGNRS